jgi:hypothetical protein
VQRSVPAPRRGEGLDVRKDQEVANAPVNRQISQP